MRISSVFLSEVMVAREARRHRLPLHHVAARGAGALAAGEHPQQAGVAPLAAAVNWSSAMSMTQVPLPTGTPASETA